MYGNGSDSVKQYVAPGSFSGAGMSVQVGASTAAPPRMPLIVEQVQGMEKRLSGLHDAISNLESRLAPVLQPEPPSNEASAKPPQHGVGLADGLVEMNGRIEYAIQRISSVVRRAEL